MSTASATYTIVNGSSGTAVADPAVTGASTSANATLEQQGNTGAGSQQWLLSPA